MTRKKILVVCVILLCISIPWGLIACDKTTENVYELKLYDNDWKELAVNERGDYIPYYETEYDGTPKGFNAICYLNGEEFYRYDYLNYVKGTKKPIMIWFDLSSGLVDFPVKKGDYRVYYEFYRGNENGVIYDTPIGMIEGSNLPVLQHQITISII